MSTSFIQPQKEYDVFLCFRGEDTRQTFTGHLYAALCQNGIKTSFGDNLLERGNNIPLEQLKVIEDSRCSIVILSNEYASSRWCLDELVKTVECMNSSGQIVVPIFYRVDPSSVRNQTGSYGEAFHRHEQDPRNDMEKVQSWRAALTKVASLSGWSLMDDMDEARFIQDFVVAISEKLRC